MTRCPHDMFPGFCVIPECPHYGDSKGHAPIEPRFIYCIHCEQAEERERAVPYGTRLFECRECASCMLCENLRAPRSDWCHSCIEKLAAPKACKWCGEPLVCKTPHITWVRAHAKRESHRSCCRKVSAARMHRHSRKEVSL